MAETQVLDAEVVGEPDTQPDFKPGQEIVPARPAPSLTVAPQVEAQELVDRLDRIREAQEKAMVRDVDYGVIPGTNKPTLLKPGAEKLGVMFQLDIQLTNEKAWGPGEHLTVISHAVVYHVPTGARMGYGEGLCTTREKKYAKRQSQRTCPECSQPTIFKSKPRADGSGGNGWYCWAKKGGCGAQFADDNDPRIASQEAGEVENPDLPDAWNCVTPDTRILTRDLRWVQAGHLVTGDVLISVAEENRDEYARPYEDAVVTVGDRFTDDLYELRMEDGRVVRCNGEHRWLVKAVNGGVEWVTTQKIHDGAVTGRPRVWRILDVGEPWSEEESVEAGYLAGLLDADGSLDVTRGVNPDGSERYHGVVVSFAQQEGGVLDRFTAGLEARCFDYSEYPHQNPRMRAAVVKVHVRGGLLEQMRLLGTIRPPRLLERWADLVDLSRRRFEGRATKVESVERVGHGELVRLGTSSHTYIAEGLVCHNTVIKMAEKRARIDAILAVTGASALFTQDLEDEVPQQQTAQQRPVQQQAQQPPQRQRTQAPQTTAQPAQRSERPATANQKSAINVRCAKAGLSVDQQKAILQWTAGFAILDRLSSPQASKLLDALGTDGDGAQQILEDIRLAVGDGDGRARTILERYDLTGGAA